MRIKMKYITKSCVILLVLLVASVIYNTKNNNASETNNYVYWYPGLVPGGRALTDKNVVLNQPRMNALGAYGKKLDVQEFKMEPRYKMLLDGQVVNQVNAFLSNLIGASRILKDSRPEACKRMVYPKHLPEVSMVIVCRDELVSTLARTINGVLNTAPEDMLKEIIIVDDGSVNVDVKLVMEMFERCVDKVKLVRNENPQGLMRARQIGIETSRADYFVVIDSHIEFNVGWFEPIVHRLVQKPKHLLTSHIGIIDKETFEYRITPDVAGTICFDPVSLTETWVPYKDEYFRKINDSVLPAESCVVPGMMMAMKKSFFLQLGGLDTGMEIWGYEHMEMSVKVWRCGGSVETLPCSRIAHLYRTQPWQRIHNTSQHVVKNQLRFVNALFDGIPKTLALKMLHKSSPSAKPGMLTERYQALDKNKCRPFDFFINKLKSLSDSLYVPVQPKASGAIYNKDLNKCLDLAEWPEGIKLLSYICTYNANQFFVLTENGQITVKGKWLATDEKGGGISAIQRPKLWRIMLSLNWAYTKRGNIVSIARNQCLGTNEYGEVVMTTCSSAPTQIWEWDRARIYNPPWGVN